MDLCGLSPTIRYIQNHYAVTPYPGPVRAYDCRLLCLLCGEADICINGGLHHLARGTLVFFPPDTPYHLTAPTDRELQILFLNFDLTDGNESITPLPPDLEEDYDRSKIILPPFVPPLDQPIVTPAGQMEEPLLNILKEYEQAAPAFREKSAALLKCVLIDLARSCSSPERQYPAAVRRALECIRQNFRSRLTNQEIAAAAGYHPYYLDSCFSRCLGCTMRQYLIRYRLELAQRSLLLTDRSIEAVAEQCGFDSPSYFAKCFKRVAGVTPSQFRQQKHARSI
ncbi:MAG: helix-turn-helix domain-containing protein [Candidatus Merdivicinus sp.]|jgi:AraC-like DNA-binding protein